jgi:hypothetical protein
LGFRVFSTPILSRYPSQSNVFRVQKPRPRALLNFNHGLNFGTQNQPRPQKIGSWTLDHHLHPRTGSFTAHALGRPPRISIPSRRWPPCPPSPLSILAPPQPLTAPTRIWFLIPFVCISCLYSRLNFRLLLPESLFRLVLVSRVYDSATRKLYSAHILKHRLNWGVGVDFVGFRVESANFYLYSALKSCFLILHHDTKPPSLQAPTPSNPHILKPSLLPAPPCMPSAPRP